MKRGTKWFIGAILLLALLFGFWVWAVDSLFADMADTTYKYEETFPSPDGAYTVTVWRSDAVWSFGPVSVRVVGTSAAGEESYETEIFSDGGQGGVTVSWPAEDKALVTLFGKEQRDEIITVTFNEDGVQLTALREEPPVTPAPTSAPVLTQAPDPAPMGMEVDVGDGEHTFWVEVVNQETWGLFEINIYREKGDAQPFQTLEGCSEDVFQQLSCYVEDMDFDGDMDFGVRISETPNGHALYSYYIWDEGSSQFVSDPYGLNELFSLGPPELIPEGKTIRTYTRWGAGSAGEVHLYRYLEKGFTCVRQMSWNWHEDAQGADFLVENYEDGEMHTVYEETCSEESLGEYIWSEEFSNWYDPSYHGT